MLLVALILAITDIGGYAVSFAAFIGALTGLYALYNSIVAAKKANSAENRATIVEEKEPRFP